MIPLRFSGVALLALALLAGCNQGGRSTGPFSGSPSSSGPGGGGSTAPGSTAPGSTAPGGTASGGSSASGPAAPTYTVAGWLPYWTYAQGDLQIDTNTGDGLDEVNLFGIGLRPDGTLVKSSGIEDPARVARIRARGGEVIPTIYDVQDATSLGAVLADPTARARAITEITALLDQGGYDGIDLDFEHAKSGNRDAFSSFVADIGAAVKARGKVFSVTIPGKRADGPSWPGYDYAALGAVADRVKIMTYGYSGTWTAYPGGPIAPTDWIVKVMDYAVTVIPPAKIQIGIPFYGYDWPDDGSAIRSATYLRAQTLLADPSASAVTFDPARGEAWFTYTGANGEAHRVWFSEERSIAAKAALAKQYGCRGVAIWALGYGDRPLWDALRATLK